MLPKLTIIEQINKIILISIDIIPCKLILISKINSKNQHTDKKSQWNISLH